MIFDTLQQLPNLTDAFNTIAGVVIIPPPVLPPVHNNGVIIDGNTSTFVKTMLSLQGGGVGAAFALAFSMHTYLFNTKFTQKQADRKTLRNILAGAAIGTLTTWGAIEFKQHIQAQKINTTTYKIIESGAASHHKPHYDYQPQQ